MALGHRRWSPKVLVFAALALTGLYMVFSSGRFGTTETASPIVLVEEETEDIAVRFDGNIFDSKGQKLALNSVENTAWKSPCFTQKFINYLKIRWPKVLLKRYQGLSLTKHSFS